MGNIDSYIQRQHKVVEQVGGRLELAARIKENIERTKELEGIDLMLAAHPDTERGLWGHGDERRSTDPVVRKLGKIKAGEFGMKRAYTNAGIIRNKVQQYLGDISWRKMKEEVYRQLLNTPGETLVKQWDKEIKEKYSEVPF